MWSIGVESESSLQSSHPSGDGTMVNPSKAHALNKRARSAAFVLKNWGSKLRDQYREQTPAPDPGEPVWLGKQGPQTITLKGTDVENLISALFRHARELDQFSWPEK